MKRKRLLFGVLLSIVLLLLTSCGSAVYSTIVQSEVSNRVGQIKQGMVKTVGSFLDRELFQKDSMSWVGIYLFGVLILFPVIFLFLLMNRIPGQSVFVPLVFALFFSILWPVYLVMMIMAFIGSFLRKLMDDVRVVGCLSR